jgi:uncharacterized protein (DUF2147 family)
MKTEEARMRAVTRITVAVGLVVLAGLAKGAAEAPEPKPGQASTPVGLWQTIGDRTGQPDGLVRIVEVDGEYIGTVVAVFSPPAPDAHPLCELCQGELKDKPIVGMIILRGVRRSGDGYSTGQILDPDEGEVYKCRIALLDDARKLEVRGYIGIPLFGRSQTWIRKE